MQVCRQVKHTIVYMSAQNRVMKWFIAANVLAVVTALAGMAWTWPILAGGCVFLMCRDCEVSINNKTNK